MYSAGLALTLSYLIVLGAWAGAWMAGVELVLALLLLGIKIYLDVTRPKSKVVAEEVTDPQEDAQDKV